jgi:HK97 gp10 family phage protein
LAEVIFTDEFNVFINAASAVEVEIACIKVENLAKVFCPVDTGRLRSSITHEVGTDGVGDVIGRVGSDVEYAIFQELGTRYMGARAFLRNALASAAL